MPVGVLFACASTSVPKRRQLIDVVSSGCKPPFSYGPNIRSRTFMLYKSDVAFLQLEENYDNFFSRKYGQVGSYFVHPPAHSCFEKADALLHAMDLTAPSRETVRIFFNRIRDRICLEEFKSIRIQVRIFNIRYRICISNSNRIFMMSISSCILSDMGLFG